MKAKIEASPRNNIRKIARELNVDKNAVSCIVRHDLGLKSMACSKVQGLTAWQCEKRLEQCKKILNRLKRHCDHILVFSDEKIFNVDAVSNSRSTRYIAKRSEDVEPAVCYIGRTKDPASAMMLGAVGANGQVFPPFWTKGTVNSTQYKNLLAHKVFPALDKAYGIGNCCWTQDDIQ